jgi:hypothetical protein
MQQALPDRSLPVGMQLEASLRLLVERSKTLKAQEIQIASLEAEISGLKLNNEVYA